MTIEIGMPVYRPSGRLEAVLTAFGLQTYKDFYITMYNDTRPEEIEEIAKDEEIVQKMRDKYDLDIRLIQNPQNYGYMKNMHQIFEKATGDVLMLFADDDIVSTDCLELIAKAFADESIGIVGRPYYWFSDNMREAVRFEGTISDDIKYVDILDSSKEGYENISKCISCAGQLSGLAFRTKYLEGMPFEEDMFTAHVYPYVYIFSRYKCAYMPHPTVAVSISTSQCHTDIYDPSPMEQWVKMYNMILSDTQYDSIRNHQIARNLTEYLGLAQIKSYGTWKELFHDIGVHVKYYPKNLIKIRFYIFALGSIVCPRPILRRLTEWFKMRVLSGKIKNWNINYGVFPIDEVERLWSAPEEGERERIA